MEKLLGTTNLPASCELSTTYEGPARLIVPTVRSSVQHGETLNLKIIVLDKAAAAKIEAHIRSLGKGKWQTVRVTHVARGVYKVSLPAAQEDFEYYLTAKTGSGKKLIWPATAPAMNQTVVVTGSER